MSNKSVYVIGKNGFLAKKLNETYKNISLIPSSEIHLVKRYSKIVYTSFQKGNSEAYKKAPKSYLLKNFEHIQNAVALAAEKKCDVFFIGSISGYSENGIYKYSNSAYGLTKSIASLIAAESDYMSFKNIVMPSIIGYPYSQLPQLFEQAVFLSRNYPTIFSQNFERNRDNDHVLNLIPIEDAVTKIWELTECQTVQNGNIFVSPAETLTVGDFYRSVERIIMRNHTPKTRLEHYIENYVKQTYCK